MWSDPQRSRRLARIYNDRFNAIALRDYTAEGQRLSLPGRAVTSFDPHPHQRTAVARILAEPSVGLYHGVGAGKTAVMAMASMELRRLGMVTKPAVVVPNHMLEQVTREWMQLYPRARILGAGSDDLRGENRARFIAQAAMGEWDAVILTHNAFGSLPVAKQTEVRYMEREIDDLRAAKESARNAGVSRATMKQIERAVASKEKELQKKLDRPRDRGLTFEQTGIDYLMIDELHEFKNLTITSNISDASKAGSQRATDLDMKVSWLRDRAGHGGKVLTGATATPIANSVSEAWVMQKYLRPDLMEEAGITDFDSWAGTFGQVVTKLELTPDGGYRPKTRFARFDNLPELLRMWHVSADVKTSDQLNIAGVPQLRQRADGRRDPETVIVPPSPELKEFMLSLADRAEKLRSTGSAGKGEDNMLVVTSDGRKAALDLRMLDRSRFEPISPETPSKVDVVADRIHRIWSTHRTHEYVDPDQRQPHPVPGALQIVFADLGTPAQGPVPRWSFYEELRAQLTALGMDPTRIRFIQDANTDEKKHRLFTGCREGQVDVLIGSTQGMGVGTNVQTRAIALHHIDCPWRPADVEQREGRILRQGNQNHEVEILRYVTEGSFDAFSWQTVERKQRFISQVMNGSLETRAADDDLASGQALSFSEVKALASGNPLIMERAEVEQDLTQLERLSRAHARNQIAREHTIEEARATQRQLTATVPDIERLISERAEIKGESFRATLTRAPIITAEPAERFTERSRIAAALTDLITRGDAHLTQGGQRRGAVEVGTITIGTTELKLSVCDSWFGERNVAASFTGLATPPLNVAVKDAIANGRGFLTRLENRVTGLDSLLADTHRRINEAHNEETEATSHLGKPFAKQAELEAARGRLADIDEQMSRTEDETPHRKEEPKVDSAGAQPNDEYRQARATSPSLSGAALAALEASGHTHSQAAHTPPAPGREENVTPQRPVPERPPHTQHRR